MKIDLLRISFLPKDQRLPEPPSGTPVSVNGYYAVTIEDGERCYYWAHGVTLEVTKEKLDRVRGNPVLHYCSTALWLHLRIMERLQCGPLQ